MKAGVPPRSRGEGSVSPLEKLAERVLAVVSEQPDLTLVETVAELRRHRIRTSRSSLSRFFQRHEITFKKQRIATLFVGESAPANGTFFYQGNTVFTRHMEAALAAAELAGDGDFLERFKGYGWYLDDLVLTPVDHLPPAERKAMCEAAVVALAERMKEYQPQAIVSLLRRIDGSVQEAIRLARCDVAYYCVPFPGQGNQLRFRQEIARILPLLPTSR
jgi:hypothetical protein